MPGPQLTSNGIPWLEDSDTVTVVRRVQSGETFTTTTIYSGSGSFEVVSAGQMSYDPAGAVDQADAMLILDPLNGVLPAVLVDDIVTVSGVVGEYSVIQVMPYTFAPIHLELYLKRGVIPYRGARA